jgi:hypothetical protein
MNWYPVHQITLPTVSILPVETLTGESVQDPLLFDFPAPANEAERRLSASCFRRSQRQRHSVSGMR